MPRYWQLNAREGVTLTPFARMLALYQKRNGYYNNKEFAEYLGVHRNTLASWFSKGYLPERDTLMHIYSRLHDVAAEEFWAAVGLEAPPRPRELAHPAAAIPDPEVTQRARMRLERDIQMIMSDPRYQSDATRQAALDLLQRLREGDHARARVIAEHVIESELGAQGAHAPLSSVLPPASLPMSDAETISRAPTEPLPERERERGRDHATK